MSSIEELWRQAEATGPGGAIRVDAEHPSDLYGGTDAADHRGLVLVTEAEPPKPPALEAVEVTSHRRHDGRWALGIWLREPSLMPMFAQLCSDLIESSRSVAPSAAAGHLLARLLRWRELLESGAGPMTMSKLRGLVGELLVLERCLDIWSPDDVVSGWMGPVSGPQDFVLPGRRIEVKATFSSSRSVHISSLEQLDTDEPLTLAVVTLTTMPGGAGIAPTELVARIDNRVLAAGAETATVYRKRLGAAGFLLDPLYNQPMFRLDSMDFYDVEGSFPKIRRQGVSAGVEKVVYDVLLSACAPHRSTLRG